MLVIHATFPIDPDSRDEALELVQDLAEHSRKEDGIVDYRVTTDVENSNVFRFFERYEDEAAFGVHAETDHFAAFEAVLPELLSGEPEVTRFDIESASPVEL
ncbi:putative quinol monooxygenase [Natronorubrum thiooxidans]|uniref:Quinol monooxygenase YgiN n=1 Tax=Natronorubrum thiooxidans TaxID=308853 RepID=A0A1N7GM42_9EURY|nr:putative quinol monooxygenase [Natronorubrum thiooxidans]SIS13576.1 Quinol monooxygenase YgiN [Natronorubrum thiooxidans]